MYVLELIYDLCSQQEFHGDGVDLYDDVIAAPPGNEENTTAPNQLPPSGGGGGGPGPGAPGPSPNGMSFPPKNPQMMQKFQLYVGNLTWV